MMCTSYYPWVDTLKGIALILIIAHHCGLARQEYYQWFYTGQGVSIFLFCSAYILVQKHNLLSTTRIKKLTYRILLPMLICTSILILVSCLFMKLDEVATKCLLGGGLGPGSYFPWMYVIFYFFIAFFKEVDSKINNITKSFLCFVVISASFELLYYFFSIQVNKDLVYSVWRILPLRYLMIIFIGFNFKELERHHLLAISILSFCGVLAWVDIYLTPLSPAYGWAGYHWFSVLFVFPLIMVLKNIDFFFLKTIGKYSYEIFLIQMMVFYLFDNFITPLYSTYQVMCKLLEIILIISLSYITIKLKKI